MMKYLIDSLTQEQLIWYSEMLIMVSALMLAGLRDEKEVNLHLQLAEIFMRHDKKELAIEELRIVQKVCQKIFTSSPSDNLVFNCAKILLLLALYFKETQATHSYTDFFRSYKTDKLIFLKFDAKEAFNKIYNEVEAIWEKKELYDSDELDGFGFKKRGREASGKVPLTDEQLKEAFS